MTEVFRAAGELQAVCEAKGWRFCFIGGLALQFWGRPRLTVDVDLTLLTGFGTEGSYIDVLLEHFAPRIADAKQFALQSRVLLLRAQSGVGLDITLGALEFEDSAVTRSSLQAVEGGESLRVCSAEDLIVMKAFAGRGRDWIDIDTILLRQAGKLDWPYIESQLTPLADLKGEPEIVDELRARRANPQA